MRLQVALVLTVLASPAWADGEIRIAGSSTLFPFVSAIAERFGQESGKPVPVVESIGTGAGIARFCEGAKPGTLDIATASRPIEPEETALCKSRGVGTIAEVPLGIDGIVLATAGPGMNLTRQQLWMALAKKVPVNGLLAPNPYTNWKQIDAALPDEPILVLGPPSTSGTRDSFNELVMDKGCAGSFPNADKKLCRTFREDGRFVEAGENDNVIVQRLMAEPGSLGLFGYSYLAANTDKIRGISIDGVAPDYKDISGGSYPLARTLYLYVKVGHVDRNPSLAEFVKAAADEKAIGPDGYLIPKGFIALPDKRRSEARAAAVELATPAE